MTFHSIVRTACRVGLAALAACVATWLPAAGARAAEAPTDFAAAMSLTTQGNEALQRVEIPVAVYANAQFADLRDVRIFNAANEPVPFALVSDVPQPSAPAETFSPPVFPVFGVPGKRVDQLDVRIEQRADGTVASIRTINAPPLTPNVPQHPINYIIDASAATLPVAVMRPKWQTPPENYIGTARIEASDDLKTWRTLVADASLVYLVQGATRLSQDRILLPPVRAKYFRVTLGASAPLLVGVQMDAPALRGEPKRQAVRVAGQPGEQPTEIRYDLGVHAPVDRLRVDVRQTNALAPVRIESRAEPKAEWRLIASSIAYRLVRDGREIASPEVSIGVNASREWRLVIDAASGGLGSPLPELEASWPVRNLVFLARGSGPFTLAVGKKDAPGVALPIASLIPGYRDQGEASLPAATVGELRKAPPPPPPLLPAFIGEQDPKKLGLWGALLVGVLLLAVMAWRLSRQMQGARTPPHGPST